jgi:hypothetical protein
MKKQLLIAAVAATMSVSAMADISITGSANVKMNAAELSTGGTTEGSSMNMDIDFAAKNGGTAVYAHLDFDDAGKISDTSNNATPNTGGSLTIDKLWMTTSIGSVNITAGDFSSCVGSVEGVQACTTTDNSIGLSTDVAGFKVGYTKSMKDSSANDSITLSGTVAGLGVKIKDSENTYTNFSVKGDVAVGTGTGFYAEQMNRDAADSDATLIAAHTVVNGITLKAADYSADATGVANSLNSGDIRPLGTSLIGDYHTAEALTMATVKDATLFGVNMDVAGNNVNVVVGEYDTNAENGLDFADIVVTRKLASGATLDVSYGKFDKSATVDTTNYGAILNVKF